MNYSNNILLRIAKLNYESRQKASALEETPEFGEAADHQGKYNIIVTVGLVIETKGVERIVRTLRRRLEFVDISRCISVVDDSEGESR